MCTDCNEVTIPIGPKGDKGDTGSTGPAGSNGTNGTNGVDGLRVLYNSMNEQGNTVTAGTQTLKNYTILANELNNDGDEIEVDIICAIGLVPTGTGTISIQIGSNISSITMITDTLMRINLKISRIDASNILHTTQYLIDDGTTSTSRLFVQTELFGSTISNPIYLKSILTNNGANQIIIYKFTVYKNKI